MSTDLPRGFRFPWVVIQHAVWLYARFTLSLRDVEELLAERGIVVSYETIGAWFARFGPAMARGLRAGRRGSNGRRHLDGVFVSIGGRRMYLWRAVDGEGEILDVLVQPRRDKAAALRLMRRLLRRRGAAPEVLVTDGLGSYAAAARELGLTAAHVRAGPRTTAPRARTCRSGSGSAGCRASEGRVPPSASSPCTPPSPTRFPPSATSSRPRATARARSPAASLSRPSPSRATAKAPPAGRTWTSRRSLETSVPTNMRPPAPGASPARARRCGLAARRPKRLSGLSDAVVAGGAPHSAPGSITPAVFGLPPATSLAGHRPAGN
jgi:transposase-like protein